jgi:hypothetical protein
VVLAEECDRLLPLGSAELGVEYGYRSLPECVIDAVYSINAHYSGVRNVVRRYEEHVCGRELTITEFLVLLGSRSADELAESFFRNRARTSPRSGILKAEAVVRFAGALQGAGIETRGDVQEPRTSHAQRRVLTIPGQRSGLSWRYFLMLAGAQDLVKPDRMILGFLEDVLDRRFTADEAQWLLGAASSILAQTYPEITPRGLDHQIWRFQRERPSA